jgi:hypothetical protein
MAWFDLLSQAPESAPAFQTAEAARKWLGGQSQTVPARMLAALGEQFEALAASPAIAPFELAHILESLRPAAITAHTGAVKRYSFQPRPLAGEAAALFAGAIRMWRALAAGYLACVERFGTAGQRDPAAIGAAAHRAMVTLRLCLDDHYLGGVEPSIRIWKNTHRLLQVAHALGVADLPLADPEFRDPAETTVAEQYAIVALSAMSDPWSLSEPEFTVMRRAYLRWRNLVVLAATPSEAAKSRWLTLEDLPALPPPLSPQTPQWIEISGVRTKIRHRLRALDEGETPEALQLGRDLSARACREMLEKLLDRLKPLKTKAAAPRDRSDSVRLAASIDDCFELIAGRPLKKEGPVSAESNRLTHDRIAIFGSAEASAPRAPDRVGEVWALVGETLEQEDLQRAADTGALRLLPGHLLAIATGHGSILGVADRVVVDREQHVQLRVRRFPGQPQAYPARSAGAGGPLNFVLFVLPAVEAVGAPASLVLPSGFAIRIKQAIFCDGGPGPLHLGALIERGQNFERYQPAARADGR